MLYAYATGEGVAFFVACCLILEYGISAAAVAVGWAAISSLSCSRSCSALDCRPLCSPPLS